MSQYRYGWDGIISIGKAKTLEENRDGRGGGRGRMRGIYGEEGIKTESYENWWGRVRIIGFPIRK